MAQHKGAWRKGPFHIEGGCPKPTLSEGSRVHQLSSPTLWWYTYQLSTSPFIDWWVCVQKTTSPIRQFTFITYEKKCACGSNAKCFVTNAYISLMLDKTDISFSFNNDYQALTEVLHYYQVMACHCFPRHNETDCQLAALIGHVTYVGLVPFKQIKCVTSLQPPVILLHAKQTVSTLFKLSKFNTEEGSV